MRGYWAFALPPENAGLADTLGWMATQLEPVAHKPGGTELWGAFWLLAAVGLALLGRTRPVLGIALALVPLTGFALAGLRAVPLYERLALWILPALYVGVSATLGTALGAVRRSPRFLVIAGGAVLAGGAALIAYDIAARGAHDYKYRFDPDAGNHQLDDRAGVQWLMSQRRRGDVLLSTYLALPAVWWYGGASIANPERGREVRGVPFLQVFYRDQSGCSSARVAAALRDYRRALVYFGFRFDDVPPGFDQLLMDLLAQLGGVTGYERFSGAGVSLVVDFTEPPMVEGFRLPRRPGIEMPDQRPPGCLGLRTARRW
jgi:hypothetical protein